MHIFFKTVKYCVIALVMLIAVALTTARLLTPILNHHRATFEKWVGHRLHSKVHITKLRALWDGLYPDLKFEGVTVMDASNQHVAIRIDTLQVDLDLVKSLWLRRLQPRHIALIGLHLHLQILPGGAFQVRGANSIQSKQPLPALNVQEILSWLLAQSHVSLKQVSISVKDSAGYAYDVSIPKIYWVNIRSQHFVYGNASVKELLGHLVKVAFHVQCLGNPGDLGHVDLKTYVHVQHLYLTDWLYLAKRFYPTLWKQYHVDDGQLNAQVWFDWRSGHCRFIQSVLQATDLKWHPIHGVSWIIDRLSGNFLWKPQSKGWRLSADQVQLILNHQPMWVNNQWTVLVQPAEQQFLIRSLDIQRICGIGLSSRLLPAAWDEALKRLNPTGSLSSIRLVHAGKWKQNTNWTQLKHYHVTAYLQKFSMRRWKSVPGIAGLSGQLSGGEGKGSLLLHSHQVSVDFGRLFPRALMADQLTGKLVWFRRWDKDYVVKGSQLKLANDHVAVVGQFALLLPKDLHQATLSLLTGVSLNDSSQVKWYFPVGIFHANLSDWLEHAFIRGDGAVGSFIFRGPIHQFPFAKGKGTFTVDAMVKKSDLHYANGWPDATHINARLIFHNKSMTCEASSGRIFNSVVHRAKAYIPEIAKQVPTVLHLSGQVAADSSDLVRYLRESPLRALFGDRVDVIQMTGHSRLDLQLKLPLESLDNLQVTGKINFNHSQLSVPHWHVSASQIMGQLLFDEHSIWSNQLTAQLFGTRTPLTIKTIQNGKDTHFMRVAWAGKLSVDQLSALAPSPLWHSFAGQTGYQASIDLHPADQKNYRQNVLHVQSDLTGVSADLPAPYQKLAGQALPLNANVFFGANQPLQAAASLKQAQVKVQMRRKGWVFSVSNAPLSGTVLYPDTFPKSPIVANLTRFTLQTAKTLPSVVHRLDPGSIPPLNISCSSFWYGNHRYQGVKLIGYPRGRSWVIKQLKLYNALFSATMDGRLMLTNAKIYRSRLSGHFHTTNLGDFLKQRKVDTSLEGASGDVYFNFNWPGWILTPTLKTLSGSLNITLGEGRIIDLGQGAASKLNFGRLLTLLSLHRILSMNFSDFTKKGYGFDKGVGKMQFSAGTLLLQKLYFEGSVARMEAKGSVNLLTKMLNLRLSVMPHITSSLPIVAAVIVNPLAGAVAWVADKVLGSVVSQMTTYHYVVSGPWTEPKVTSLQRGNGGTSG